MISKYDNLLQQYYYINEQGDVSFDSPLEVKIQKKCNPLQKFKMLVKKISRKEEKVEYVGDGTYESELSVSDSDTESYDSIQTPTTHVNIGPTTNIGFLDEEKIFSQDFDYDSDLNSLESIDSNDVMSFNGDYLLGQYSNATLEDIDMNYHHYYHEKKNSISDDWYKQFEIFELRQTLLRELEL